VISHEIDDSRHLPDGQLGLRRSWDLDEQVPRKERHGDHLLSIAPFALLIEQRKKMNNSEAFQSRSRDFFLA
jgi:hypothetical protein